MFYDDVVKITRCNRLQLLFTYKFNLAKLLQALKFADLFPCFRSGRRIFANMIFRVLAT